MKHWLVTLRETVDLADFDRAADRLDCRRDPGARPVPLQDGEVVIRVMGPESIRDSLARIPAVSDVHPEETLGLM